MALIKRLGPALRSWRMMASVKILNPAPSLSHSPRFTPFVYHEAGAYDGYRSEGSRRKWMRELVFHTILAIFKQFSYWRKKLRSSEKLQRLLRLRQWCLVSHVSFLYPVKVVIGKVPEQELESFIAVLSQVEVYSCLPSSTSHFQINTVMEYQFILWQFLRLAYFNWLWSRYRKKSGQQCFT